MAYLTYSEALLVLILVTLPALYFGMEPGVPWGPVPPQNYTWVHSAPTIINPESNTLLLKFKFLFYFSLEFFCHTKIKGSITILVLSEMAKSNPGLGATSTSSPGW